MATKISADVSTNVDITCRKGDNFYLVSTLTNSDNTIFDLTTYTLAEFIVTNSNNNTVRKFYAGAASTSTEIHIYNAITFNTTTGQIIIDVNGGDMGIPEGNYRYILKIISATPLALYTILHGKFKVID